MEVTTEDSIFYHGFNPFMELHYNWKYELEISIAIGDLYRQAIAVKNIARFYYHCGHINEVFTCLNESLYLFRLIADFHNEAMVLYDIAGLYYDLGNSNRGDKIFNHYLSLDAYTKCLYLFDFIDSALDSMLIKQDILFNIGSIYSNLGRKQEALEYYQKSLHLAKVSRDYNSEAIALSNIGSIYADLCENQTALEYYQQALSLSKLLKHRVGEAIILDNIGNIYSDLSENQTALEYFRQALLLNEAEGYQNGQIGNLLCIGCIYANSNESQKALEYFQKSLYLSKIAKDYVLEAKALNNIGGIYSDLSEKQKALEYFQQALYLAELSGSNISKAVTLNNIGLVYTQLGKKQKALESYQQALLLNQAAGYRKGETINLNSIGLLYVELEQMEKALECFQQALLLDKTIGDSYGSATTLNNIGLVYGGLGKAQKALEYFQEALLLDQSPGKYRSQANSLNNIGNIYSILGEKKKALQYFQQALSLTKVVGDRILEARILSDIGELQFEIKQYHHAHNNLLQAIELLESINSQELDDELKISFFDTYRYKYLFLQEILIVEDKVAAAIEIAERGRARILVDLLNNRFANKSEFIPVAKPAISELKNIAKLHNSTLITYSIILTEEALDNCVSLSLYIYLITPDHTIEFRKINLTANNFNLFQTIQAARRVTTTALQQKRDVQKLIFYSYSLEDLAVGDYVKLQGEFPTDESWQIIAINRSNQTVSLDQTRREEPLENVSIDRIASKTDTSLRQLHQILIDPIADLLPQDPTEKVIFMPQGPLFGVPFAALQDAQGQYLIEKHTILTSPSIQVLAQTATQNERLAQQPQNRGKALVVGNPYPYPDGLKSLENASAEAQQIASLLGVQPLLGKKATEAEVLSQMPQADIIHFATHASFNDQRGLSSAIYLTAEPGAPDDGLFQTPGRITAEDIFNQFENNPLNARLVVLSACDTGQGEITGDGVIGLSRSLIAAGVPSVLVSLWSVDDASTKTLMTEFYRQWQQQGVDKATALRNAMLATKAQYPDPYYWSGFTLIGEAD